MDIHAYLGPYIALPEMTEKMPATIWSCPNLLCDQSFKEKTTSTKFCPNCGKGMEWLDIQRERRISPYDLSIPGTLTIYCSEQHGYFIGEYNGIKINTHTDSVTDISSLGVDERLKDFRLKYSDFITNLEKDVYGKKLDVTFGLLLTWG